jgi:MoaA/NifB/PqqE/SkfB family radical SAM enzyme
LVDIIRCFRRRGIIVNFQSNGTLVDRVLAASGIKGVFPSFSLDGPRDVHNKIRGRSFVFDRNMKILHALREQLHKGIIITSVICEDNLHVLKDLIGLLKEEDLVPDLIIFELARWITKEMVEDTRKLLRVDEEDLPPHLKDRENPSFSYEDFSRWLTELHEALEQDEFNYLFLPKNLLEKSKEFYYRTYRQSHELFCGHLEVLRIGSEGDITPCFNIRNSLGNVTQDSIETIWNSRGFRDYRVNLIENNLAPICESCFRCLDIHTYKEPGLLDGAKGMVKRVLRFPRRMMYRN